MIAMSPSTGEILGMANYPTFNPNDPNLTPEQRMKLRRAMELQKKP